MDGFLIINKPKGITSFGVCNKIKHLFNERHVGHTGTLDPDTTGVLVVGIGKACKLMSLLNEHDKKYQTTILLGKSSDTLDISGKILEDVKTNIAEDKIKEALENLSKETSQIPPMYSAIKVNGKKLYELARSGKEVDLKPRGIKIYDYELNGFKLIDGYQAIDITLSVSKGFYVRSYARDFGKMLGVPSLMYSLDRISAGDYDKSEAIDLDDITEDNLITIDKMFDLDILEVNDYIAGLVKNGVYLDERQIKTNNRFKVFNKGNLIAIYEPAGEYKYKPIVIL